MFDNCHHCPAGEFHLLPEYEYCVTPGLVPLPAPEILSPLERVKVAEALAAIQYVGACAIAAVGEVTGVHAAKNSGLCIAEAVNLNADKIIVKLIMNVSIKEPIFLICLIEYSFYSVINSIHLNFYGFS